ncbi:MAG: response regulator [Oscillatoriales cyanobacterium RM2_1_1]|nr:response regulator [Oscillatoriales cyanobacterium SM2_3_0]NJO44804.1 response regulator [Oscillatoriales cyanobacterium RM2_1_1]
MNSLKKPKSKILVVDDEPDNLDLLYRTFYRKYKVLRADSGREALDILDQEKDVSVIISDQRMPSMTGTELLSFSAEKYPNAIRILLTGYTDVEDLVEAINSGKVFKYVTKPWEAEELSVIVDQALETHNVLKTRTEELQRALQQETLLYAVTSTIRSALNYREMLQRIVETVGQTFNVSYCILQPFQDGKLIDERFVYQAPHSETQLAQIPEAEIRQLIWETAEVQVIQDAQIDPQIQQYPQRQKAYKAMNICSSLVVPLFYRQELMAVLALHQVGEPRIWFDYEVQLSATVADQAALALSQARAYEQVQELARRETLVNTITSAIRSSLEPQKIFAAITQQLGQALHVDGCALSLWTREDEFVQCVGLYDSSQRQTAVASDWADSSVTDSSLDLNDSESVPWDQIPINSEILPQSAAPIRGNPVLQRLLETLQPVVIDNLNQQPDFNFPDLPLRSQAKALLVVPLLLEHDKIIGSISLRQNHATRSWQEAEINLVQIVAAQAALAVQQARLYQQTRQQAQRLLEADRLKTEFFQNISHEFRTPLTLMIGPLESAIAQSQGLPYDQSKIALRNARRLLRLVNQLLDLQKFDAGRMQPRFRPCDLVTFCQQTVESFQAYCDKKGINLEAQLQECPALYLDLERFDKVLYNLLSNAMKFTSEGGTIQVLLEETEDYCLLQVKDSGIGIRADQIPHLFERFRQAEGSTNRSYEGTGLGLALVKELVDLHQGKIQVDSVYGEGTAFTIQLPLGSAHLPPDQVLETPAELNTQRAAVEFADIEVESSEEPLVMDQNGAISALNLINTSEPPPDLRQNCILVVDDNPDLRAYLTSILRNARFNVVTARNGLEGFDQAKLYDPEVIITDLMMPLVSGLDLIRMVREDEQLRGTPMILLTAKADEDTRIEGVERGADAYVSKPFNDRELLAEVRNLRALKQNERRIAELNRYLTESVLRRFLPPTMVERAAQGDMVLDLNPEPRLITILFSDIVGFTRMSNQLQSRRVAEVLNEYLSEMTHAVFANGGTVDKFIGDAVMAIYGAPEELTPEEQVRRAIASARQMLRSLGKLNQSWAERGLVGQGGVEPVRFRCGIHQGMAVVGMFGAQERSDYTAIGPPVNITARLQEAAEPNSILVSAEVAAYLSLQEVVAAESLQFKGMDDPIPTFVVSSEAIAHEEIKSEVRS